MLFRAAMMGMVVTAFGVASAWACSCLPDPSAQEAFGRADVVVRVRLERTVGAKTDADLLAAPGPMNHAVLRVESVYKGDLTAGHTIDIAQGHGSFCGWFFSEENKGREYLLYLDAANAETKVFPTPMCGRSRNIAEATVDLNYLERRAKLESRTVLAGVIKDMRAGFAGKKGVTVTVRGGGRSYSRRTDKGGYFEITGLLPGRYIVSVPGKVDSFYFAPSAKGTHGDYAKARGGGAEVNVNDGKMTEVEIHLN